MTMLKLIIAAITVGLLSLVGIVLAPKLFANMGQDLVDTNKYAARMSALIRDTPNCEQFKNRFAELGKNATGMNGAFTTAIVQTKDAANKSGCSKP